jgi:processive 1,2-diacylglycerol beta-glucosyltransferase
MRKKRVLMTMLEVGFGHKAPARAVKDAMEELHPDRYSIDIVDFAKEVGAETQDWIIKTSWDVALAFPLTARIGYVIMELNRKNRSFIDVLYKEVIDLGVEYLLRREPDLVFATHPLCLYIASRARKERGLGAKIVAFVVDPFDGYSLWADEGADMILVASEQSKRRLVEHGIDETKILNTGFPIRKSFFDQKRPVDEIARELGLIPDQPTLLVSAGGQGIGKVFGFVDLACRLGLALNIVTVAGKNAATKRRMDRLRDTVKTRTNLVSLGFVNNMDELIRACDVVVGKSGASTFMEAAFMGKPVILTEWATYNDWYIVSFALDSGVGWYCPSAMSFISTVKRLSEPGQLEACRSRVVALGIKNGTDEVAAYLSGLLEG